MGICVAKFEFEVVPSLTLVRDTLAERLQRPVELVEAPSCFEFGLSMDGRRYKGYRLIPRERALVTDGYIIDPDRPWYEFPEYRLLCRALTELGGRPAEIELDLEEFRQRFDFDGKVPTALEVHERILALGGWSQGTRPPREDGPSYIPPAFSLEAPGLLPVVTSVEISAGPGEINLCAAVGTSLLHETAEALRSLGGREVDEP
jgi:hypothetical protein